MIHIAYAGNKFVFKGILLSVMSIIKHCSEPITIHILTMDFTEQKPSYLSISDEQIDLLNNIIRKVNPSNCVVKHDMRNYYIQYFANGANKNSEYTPYTMLRLFFDLPANIPDKIIYIDVDTMVLKDITEMYNIDMTEYEVGAVLDYMGKFWIAPTYCNAGVLLLNMAKIKQTKLFDKCRERVIKKWMKMPDQSAIHKCVQYKMYLPSKYNEQRDIKPDTMIKHFNKGIKWTPFFHIYNIKQWDFKNVHKKLNIHDFDDIFDIFTNLTNKYPCILN